MGILKGRQKGFTLIELLIVVAILGILAAVVIPNVGRFLGSGEEEAQDTEFQNIITAVGAMMVDNGISSIPFLTSGSSANCSIGFDTMNAWPDNTSNVANGGKESDPNGNPYNDINDSPGYKLFGHDIIADIATNTLNNVNYMTAGTANFCYTSTADGTIAQYDSGGDQCNPVRVEACG